MSFEAATLRDWRVYFLQEKLPEGCGFAELAQLVEELEDAAETASKVEALENRVNDLESDAKGHAEELAEAEKERDEAKKAVSRIRDLLDT